MLKIAKSKISKSIFEIFDFLIFNIFQIDFFRKFFQSIFFDFFLGLEQIFFGVENKLGYSFDVKFSDLSIYGVFRAFGAL